MVVNPAIVARNIEIARSGRTVIPSASLTVEAGLWLGVIGANGSGKTTLLRALAGRLPIANGSLEIDGHECANDRSARARSVGIAPEAVDLPSMLTGRQIFCCIDRGFDCDRYNGKLCQLAKALEIENLDQIPMSSCSAGMKQRIAIFAAFLRHQGIVILDEPFNWLDPVAVFDLRTALAALSKSGLTIITALHDLRALCSSCNEAILLKDGEIVLRLDKDEMTSAARTPIEFERQTIRHLRASASHSKTPAAHRS